MRVLLVGSGAREHALAWKLRRSPRLDELFVAPGNGGTASIALNLPIKPLDLDGLVAAARLHRVDLVVIGPEDPLALGLADRLRAAGFAVFGPGAAAARIEASKSFARQLMQRYGIPCGEGQAFSDPAQALSYLQQRRPPFVIKADGLAAGKGVVVATTRDEAEQTVRAMLVDRAFGPAGDTVVIEEYLEGAEVSAHAFSDGSTVLPLPFSRDHKRALDGDRGPNTGGMGVYSPVPFVDETLAAEIEAGVVRRVIQALAQERTPFIGTIYPGLMLTRRGPRVLEFNCRFGDPETQVLLPRLESDLLEVLHAAALNKLQTVRPDWSRAAAVGVVMASGGYPGEYSAGYPIEGLETVDADVLVFHGGTRLEDGRLLTAGGRVLTVVALGETLAAARERAYDNVRRISFEGAHYRTDIAAGLEG